VSVAFRKTHVVKVRQVARCIVLTIPSDIARTLDLKPGASAVMCLTQQATVTVRFYKQATDRLVEVRPATRFGEMLTDNHKIEKKI
jgi:hypothetical protein